MILSEKAMDTAIRDYYETYCNPSADDVFLGKPACNVWLISRGNIRISLHCHIISGKVTRADYEKGEKLGG